MSHIAPLFWHHGEPEDVIIAELEAVRSSGLREIIVEPRPHPDYLGERWWHDLEIVLSAARDREMRVWFFDDARFPSGWLNGQVSSSFPHLRKRFLGEQHIDVQGPATGTSFALRPWLRGDDTIHAVVAGRRLTDDSLDDESLIELSGSIHGDTLYWDIPEGRWRVVVVIETSNGHEPETADYLNPIEEGAAQAHIAVVHQPHLQRFQAQFGPVIAGFFQDEPRFGNAKTYQFRLGDARERVWGLGSSDVLPFSALLNRRLKKRWGADAHRFLPLLWWQGDPEVTAHTRFGYMEEVTRIYEEFQRDLGDWCEEQGVSFIGHVVEDNGAHARLGYGAGHYFRAMTGQHMGGVDVVQHVQPGASFGRRSGSFGYYDDDFYFWGLSKLASSAAHIDPRKRGRAMCEAFGAYGWHEGLRLMKWITDHLAVRGINFLVPHAFSARQWDPDCPPHFYNGGHNPQWQFFSIWRLYAERLSAAFSDGVHISDAAVLYHAEAEWAGGYQPFEHVIRELQRIQLDADVVPIDAVMAAQIGPDGSLRIGGESYPILLIPYAERLPASFVEFLLENDVRCVFVDGSPNGFADRRDSALYERLTDAAIVAPLCGIAGTLPQKVATTTVEPDLRVMRYDKDGTRQILVLNESIHHTVDTELTVSGMNGPLVSTDLINDRTFAATTRTAEGGTAIRIHLAPGETRLIHNAWTEGLTPEPRWRALYTLSQRSWEISARSVDANEFASQNFTELGPVNTPGRLPKHAGTIRYEKQLDLTDVDALNLGEVGELAAVWVGGTPLGVRIAAPYRFDTSGFSGLVSLVVEVTTTLAPLLAQENLFDASVALDPAGLIGPIVAERSIR